MYNYIIFKYLIFDHKVEVKIKTIKKYNLKNVYNEIITNYSITA